MTGVGLAGLCVLALMETASSVADRVDWLLYALLAMASLIVATVFGLIVFYGVRYRATAKADRSDPVSNTTPIELAWTSATFFGFLGLFFWGAHVYFDIKQPPEHATTVYVVGKQWMWKVYHPEGRQEINSLHVPTGQPVRLVLTSQDVIHSFFVPAFRLKQDAVPGRYTDMWFEVTHPGRYVLKCAEYCGTDHSGMRGEVVALRPHDYQVWASARPERGAVPGTPGTPEGGLAVRGRGAFFQLGCNSCHIPRGSKRAPRLDGIWMQEIRLHNGETVVGDQQYIRESILEPNAKISAGYEEPSLMPTYAGQVTEEQLIELIELIRSLEHGWPEELWEGDAPAGGEPR
jgi:cytochrome c oxidase subunit 2